MAVKPTSETFTIREGASIVVDFQGGQTGGGVETVSIPTNLDTLNREVLQIQEVDFDLQGMSFWAGVMARNNGSVDPAAVYINGDLYVILTEVDPAIDPNVLSLDSPHFIAGKHLSMIAGLVIQSDDNPDTASFSSVAAQEAPLFTTAAKELFLTVSYGFNGNDNTTPGLNNATIRGVMRTMANRGRADADTYASILTGLFS